MSGKKRLLVVGSGAREHAIAKALSESPEVGDVYVLPGNGGTATFANNLDAGMPAIDAAHKHKIDFTIVGPEAPLGDGIVNRFRRDSLSICGPTQAAASVELSKADTRLRAHRAKIPGPRFAIFTDREAAAHHSVLFNGHIVYKADGLAAGKGAYVCSTYRDVHDALLKLMVEKKHGNAGDRVVAEEKLSGPEVSVHALCNGLQAIMLPSSQDYKRLHAGPGAPNTGGMGAIAPSPILYSQSDLALVKATFVDRMLESLAEDERPYSGFLYPGLMVTDSGPRLLEYNCRAGDPETTSLLALLESSAYELFLHSISDQKFRTPPKWGEGVAVNVVLAAAGYPEKPKTGMPIHGLEIAEQLANVSVIHAGTKFVDGTYYVAGGRVLNIVARGANFEEARERVYEAIKYIEFEGMQYRRDIGEEYVQKKAA